MVSFSSCPSINLNLELLLYRIGFKLLALNPNSYSNPLVSYSRSYR